MDTGQVLTIVSMTGAVVASVGIVTWQLVLYIGRAAKDLHETITEVDTARLEDGRDIRNKLEGATNSLDTKFNKVRDEMSNFRDSYVRRDDLNNVIDRLENSQKALMDQIMRLQEKLDAVLIKFIRRGSESEDRA